MTIARLILILIVAFILLIPNLVALYISNKNTLIKYKPTILSIFKFSEFMLKSFIFVPIITLFTYPKSIKDIGPSIAIIFWLALILFIILVENAYRKDYLENLSKINNEQKVRDILQDQISEYKKMKAAESKILHKKHT